MSKCGERRGYQAHINRGEEACRPCKDAKAAYSKEYRRRKKLGLPTKTLTPCGTPGALKRHYQNREPACEACLAVGRSYPSYQRKYKPKRRSIHDFPGVGIVDCRQCGKPQAEHDLADTSCFRKALRERIEAA